MKIPIGTYLRLLRSYLIPQHNHVLLLAFLLFISIGFQLLSPQVIRYFIDTVEEGGAQGTLLLTGLLYLVVVLLERAAFIGTSYYSQNVAWTATNGLRSDLARHVLKLDMSFHNAHTPGELLERIDGDVDRLANFFSEFLLQILTGLLLTIGVLILLFQEDWRVGLVLAIFVVAYLVVHARGQQMAEPHWEKEREHVADMVGFTEERVAGVRDIQTSGAVEYMIHRFTEIMRRRAYQALKADVVTDIGWTISKIFYDLGIVAAMGLGAYLFLNGQMSLGTIYLILHYLSMLNRPLNRIGSQIEDLQRVRVSIQRVNQLIETKSKILDRAIPRDGGAKLASGVPIGIQFDHVHFRYSPDTPVLQDVAFTLRAGATLGLLGRTGSGKTTLSRLLFRLYDVDCGTITLDGVDIRQPQLADLRHHVGMVTQDVQLFQASVRDNLTLFNAKLPDTFILESLKTLGLESWIESLQDGLDTLLVANGAGLSAGEAQLLALARVFLKDPGLVILDEASSRLDPATEQLLEQALDKLLQDRTSIIIAHRLSTVRRADQILILEEGKMQEFGDYDELVQNPNSVFAGLLRTGLEEVLV